MTVLVPLPTVTLGELVDIRSSLTDPCLATKSSLPHVGPEHIISGSGNITWDAVRSCAEDGVTSGKYEFEAGDILYSKIRPYLNKVALADRHGLCSADMYAIQVSSKCDKNYIYRYLQTPEFLAYAASFSGRANIPKINRQQLLSSPVSLPPLAQQRRIAAILDKAAALRRKRKRAIDLLDGLTQSIFLEMFGDLVGNSKRWGATHALGNLADIVSGITKGRRLNGAPVRQVPYLAVSNVQDKFLDMTVVKAIEATEDEIQRYRLRRNDLLLTEGGDPDKLGRGTLWADELDESIHQNHIFRVRVTSSEVQPFYLIWLLGSPYGKAYFLRSAKQTTGIASINKRQLSDFPVVLPPVSLQAEFEEFGCSVAQAAEKERSALNGIEGLFDSLQQRAFSGQL